LVQQAIVFTKNSAIPAMLIKINIQTNIPSPRRRAGERNPEVFLAISVNFCEFLRKNPENRKFLPTSKFDISPLITITYSKSSSWAALKLQITDHRAK
jgi:hypothetical protein